MIKKNSTNSKSAGAGINTPVKNIFLNVVIFLLGALILYMAFAIVKKLINKDSEQNMSVQVQVPSEIIQAEVLNGCGMAGVGDKFTDYLRNNKVDVVNVGNYISFDIVKTIVIDRTGNLSNAKKIASMLGVKKENVIQQLNNDYFLDVSVVIGKDYNQLKPLK
ncbi:MAG: LytR C-terminal domain-containing protein [Ignavibacteria bacterium]